MLFPPCAEVSLAEGPEPCLYYHLGLSYLSTTCWISLELPDPNPECPHPNPNLNTDTNTFFSASVTAEGRTNPVMVQLVRFLPHLLLQKGEQRHQHHCHRLASINVTKLSLRMQIISGYRISMCKQRSLNPLTFVTRGYRRSWQKGW